MITTIDTKGGAMADWAAILAVAGKALSIRMPGQIETSKSRRWIEPCVWLDMRVDKIAEKLAGKRSADRPGAHRGIVCEHSAKQG